MATASTVHLNTNQHPEFYLPPISEETAKATSRLLQENHDKYHIFFNPSGFHNHIAHHLLSIYALNASPAIIEKQYRLNAGYQRASLAPEQSIVKDMHDYDSFQAYLGDEKNYTDFLAFFQAEIEQHGWQDTLNTWVFGGGERADDMLGRMFAGFLHPIIHLGFGVEFQQPAIMAEALAQAAVHSTWMGSFLRESEKAAGEQRPKEHKTIVQLLSEIRADTELSTAARWSDGNKVREGIIGRAAERMIGYASQYSISDASQLSEKNAEMTNAVMYYTGAAQKPAKAVKFDFYFIHCANCTIFLPAFLNAPWLSDAHKIRLLEWKVRNDLVMYASRRSPELLLDQVVNYAAKEPSGWDNIMRRVLERDDDGHAAKLVRALAHGQKICEPYEGKDGFPLGKDLWLQLGHMAIDSVEAPGPTWIHSCGFEEAWADIKPRAQL